MKAKVIIGSLLATVMTFEVVAQRVENDDMYFNSKDREKLKAEKGDVSVNDKIDSDYNTFRKKHFDKNEPETEVVNGTANPTDSYSARTINPEYISRSNAEQASEEENYYIDGYVPANTYDSYSASANNNNLNYNNSYYGTYGYGSPYGSMYGNGACSPWMNPYGYAGSGMALSLGYMWGSPSWNYGMSYGWGNAYNPYGFYPSYYSPYYSGYGYGYPTYYGNNDASRPNYGKRPSRHSAIVSPTPRSSERVSSNTSTSGSSSGRTRQPVDEYYVKPFKRTPTTGSFLDPTSGGSRYASPRSTDSPGSRTRDSYSSPSRESRSSYSTPTRSSSSGVSMPSRSSGGSGGSSPAPRKRD
jgi:hypothetical protein